MQRREHTPPVFDGHNDVLTTPAGLVEAREGGHLDLARMRAGGMRGGIFAIFTPSEERWTEPVALADGTLEVPYAPPLDPGAAAAHATAAAGRLLAAERAGLVRLARRRADLELRAEGPPVAVLHLEGAEAIDPELAALDTWFAAGLRSLGPVWSRANAFASGVPFRFPSSPDTGPGLTAAGSGLVRRCAELGILVDLSHLNAAGFWDVAALAPGPLVASHSGVHELCAASRNLTGEQLDVIGRTGGLVGIPFAPAFLRPDFADAVDTPLELVVAHALHVRDRLGPEHVALGSDFDGAKVPAALGDAAGLPGLLDALRAGGFSADELELLAHRNWCRVLSAWWRA